MRHGEDGVALAEFDALCDLDLLGPAQQADGAHRAHVHADGVRGVRVVRFGRRVFWRVRILSFDFLVVPHEVAFLVGILFHDFDPHVGEALDHQGDRFVVVLVGQLLVDLVQRQVSLFAPMRDQFFKSVVLVGGGCGVFAHGTG